LTETPSSRAPVWAILTLSAILLTGCVEALISPKTVVDRAIEARTTADIAEDNRIVLEVNRIMAKHGTIKASTEIYEQRLLVTGLFDDRALYDAFRKDVEGITGVKQLYWHVAFMSEADQEKNKDTLIDWPEAMVLDNKTGLRLVGAAGVADVNYRVAADAFGYIYLLGRARSQEEMNKALTLARETEGVRKVFNYVEVRP